MTRRPLSPIAMILIALGATSACSGEYTPPSRAIAQDMAATSAAGSGSSHLSSTTTFRDSDLAAPRR